jgi:hypothetical protein
VLEALGMSKTDSLDNLTDDAKELLRKAQKELENALGW